MALPEGVTTCTYIVGPGGTSFGTEMKASATITPVFGTGDGKRIIYEPAGWVFTNIEEKVSEDADGIVSFDLPHVDQAGFVTPGGEPITMWAYKIDVNYSTSGPSKQNVPYTQMVQPLVGQDDVDLDLVADGTTVAPLVLPPTFVTSMAGFSGAVTLEQLVNALAPHFARTVEHGADADVARPPAALVTIWAGTVDPDLKDDDYDLWVGPEA